jgi:hypothetical protein
VVHSYLTDATAYLSNRVKSGRPTGPVMWFNANGANSLVPLSRWSSNHRIALQYYPAMYHALV